MCCPDNGAALAIKERKDSGMLYIGVDLGTSAVKLLLMAADGKIENIVSKEYPLFFPIRAGRSRTRKTGGKQW